MEDLEEAMTGIVVRALVQAARMEVESDYEYCETSDLLHNDYMEKEDELYWIAIRDKEEADIGRCHALVERFSEYLIRRLG